MKKFFNISRPYKFDFNDIRCFLTLVNVILIMLFGLSVAYFGLAIAVFGLSVTWFARKEESIALYSICQLSF